MTFWVDLQFLKIQVILIFLRFYRKKTVTIILHSEDWEGIRGGGPQWPVSGRNRPAGKIFCTIKNYIKNNEFTW